MELKALLPNCRTSDLESFHPKMDAPFNGLNQRFFALCPVTQLLTLWLSKPLLQVGVAPLISHSVRSEEALHKKMQSNLEWCNVICHNNY